METDLLDPLEWCNRCARRLVELDPEMFAGEAQALARDLHAFERTRAMGPGGAADFVATEMKRSDRGPFERRARPRLPGESYGSGRAG